MEYDERVQYPFDPIAAEICYRQTADETDAGTTTDGGNDGGATPDGSGGKTW